MSSTSSSSSDDDEYVLEAIYEFNLLLARAALATALSVIEALGDQESDYFVNPDRPKIDRPLLASHESIFRMNVGFSIGEFEELCSYVCPVLDLCARSTGQMRLAPGRPPKLSGPERVLAAIFYLKHNTTGRYESIGWNYSRSGVFDDTFFVLSTIWKALYQEIQWPDADRRRVLGARIATMPGCIGFVDGTLCRINRPKRPDHGVYYNCPKRGYFLTSSIILLLLIMIGSLSM